jgi:hypothetical protein
VIHSRDHCLCSFGKIVSAAVNFILSRSPSSLALLPTTVHLSPHIPRHQSPLR